MCVKTGVDEFMSFYIGPDDKKGFRAEVTIDGEKQEQTFRVFSHAVEWVEGLRKEEIEKNEVERSKEETA